MNYSKKGTKKKQDELSKKGHKKRKRAVLVFKIVLIVFVIAVVLAGAAGVKYVKGIMAEAPTIDLDDISPVGFKSTVLDADGNVTAELVAEGSNREYVTLDKVPIDLQHAFVAIEDSRFYEHNGIDIKGIIRAGVKGITSGHFSEGASTITQQLLKNNVFDGWTSETEQERWTRKFQEWYLAVQIEKTEGVDKDVIMEKYLNSINLGQNTLGVQTASKRYFGKDVSELTLSECAVLAGITKNPSAYNPISYPEKNKERRDKVLRDMLEQGYIDQAEYDEAMADDVYDRIQLVDLEEKSESNITSYFVDALIDDIIVDLQEKAGYTENEAYFAIYSGGLTIYSTQNPQIQAICDSVANNDEYYDGVVKWSFSYALSIKHADETIEHLSEQKLQRHFEEKYGVDNYFITFSSQEEAQAKIDEYKADILAEGDTILGERVTFTKQPQTAFTVMDQYTGEIVAMVGGRGDKTGSRTLNRATASTQQPGSTFKILSTYAPALELGEYTLATAVDNGPYAYENGKSIKNANGRYTGLTSIRDAIIDSINIVAVKTLTDITVQTGMDFLEKFGFTTITKDDFGQAMALGGLDRGVYNDELTAAYAAIAKGGVYTEPILYTRIVDHEGNVVIENEPETKVVLKETTAFLLTDAMQDVMTKGTGTSANFPGMSIAGKTGTTNDNRDSVFVGYTPYYTCAVWVGNDDNSEMSSNRYSRYIWKAAMQQIHEDMEDIGFAAAPDGITRVTVCSKTGMLPAEDICEDTHTEYFTKGTAPTKICDLHEKVKICKDSNLLATEFCPIESVEEKVLLKDANTETQDKELAIPTEICTVHNQQTYQQQLQQQLQEQLQNQLQNLPHGQQIP